MPPVRRTAAMSVAEAPIAVSRAFLGPISFIALFRPKRKALLATSGIAARSGRRKTPFGDDRKRQTFAFLHVPESVETREGIQSHRHAKAERPRVEC